MMIPDVILSWPRNCDYPLWRQFLRQNRYRFAKVIISFTETNAGEDYRNFIKLAMKEDRCEFIGPVPLNADQDWRNVAVNRALVISDAKWVWFTEQDFYPKKGFWEEVEKYAVNMYCDVVAAFDSGRMHPCCIFARRWAIDQTKKNFAIIPGKADHFRVFQEDLKGLPALHVSRISETNYYHFNGLSHNFTLASEGNPPNYKPNEFKKYLSDCLAVKVPLDDRFVKVVKRCTM